MTGFGFTRRVKLDSAPMMSLSSPLSLSSPSLSLSLSACACGRPVLFSLLVPLLGSLMNLCPGFAALGALVSLLVGHRYPKPKTTNDYSNGTGTYIGSTLGWFHNSMYISQYKIPIHGPSFEEICYTHMANQGSSVLLN